MRFLVADTFAKSIARLDDRAQRSVKCAAFGFQMNPSQPSLRLHKLVHARDAGFWSLSVNRDLRIILHRAQAEVVFCYADHHDRAYAWAERRKLERHPMTGALALVEVVERAREVVATTPDPVPETPMRNGRRLEGVLRKSPLTVLDLQRRMRTRARAAAPLADGSKASTADASAGRPLAQLLKLAQRLGSAADAPPEERRPCGASRRELGTRKAAVCADRGLPLHAKIFALSLLAAPWPVLASIVAWSASSRGLGQGAALALSPGAAGSLLLACTGFLAARWVAAAAHEALRQSERIRDGIRTGNFEARADPALVDPVLRPVLRATYETVEAFAVPFERATAALARMARGELPEPIAESHGGEFDRQRDAINAIVRFVQLRSEDIRLLIGGVSRHGGEASDEAVAGQGRS